MTWCTRLAIMRFLPKFLLSILFLLIAGCSATKNVSYLTPTSSATPILGQSNNLVVTELDAITLGGKLFEEKGGIMWIDAPTIVLTKEMLYTEAIKLLGEGIAQYDLWPVETKVWLVVFKGQWQLIPLDPNQANPQPLNYEGCVFSLFTAVKGEWLAGGDFVCPPN
jgi:hypothetical protein